MIGTQIVLALAKDRKSRKYFLQIEMTPPNSPPISCFDESSDNISLDTTH